MRLDEVLSTPYKFSYPSILRYQIYYNFKDHEDVEYEVIFHKKRLNEYEILFDVIENNFELTHSKNEYKVFSTIIAVCKEFIKDFSPKKLQFAAEKNPRLELDYMNDWLRKQQLN